MSDPEREESSDRGFKVEDRRRFSPTGEPRDTESQEATPASAEETGAGTATQDAPGTADAVPGGGANAGASASEPFFDITFTTFTMSLSTQALVHLGEIEDPQTKTAAVDLAAAKQLIDILGMLRDKTRGNLDENEERLLDTILYDLRLRYVERAKRAPSA